ncbi:hypothetical protein [Streptomyces sp. NPDC047000]|uniref:hypothetical protein n=1 Tax=Streptomyces sp. NPDC047000 TaxID=3155474 RepID=UPI0033F5A6C3
MGAGWVAGVTRARALAAGRAGPGTARRLAAAPGLPDALRTLASTPYRRGLDVRAAVAEAQRGVSDALVWWLRVLAGWQPRPGALAVRLLASPFEIANTRRRLLALSGASDMSGVADTPGTSDTPGDTGTPPPAPYRLGALATAWPRLSRASSPSQLRAVLTASAWGDPGGASAAAVLTGMRLSAAARTAAAVPCAARWAAGEAALLVAREVFVTGLPLTRTAEHRAVPLLGAGALRAAAAGRFEEFRDRLPAGARWALEGTERPRDLWRAEARWWPRVERDGLALLERTRYDVAPVAGAVAVLGADAWRVRAGLECAGRGTGALEAFDELLG